VGEEAAEQDHTHPFVEALPNEAGRATRIDHATGDKLSGGDGEHQGSTKKNQAAEEDSDDDTEKEDTDEHRDQEVDKAFDDEEEDS